MDSGSSTILSIRSGTFSIPILALGNGWLVADKPCELSVHHDPGMTCVRSFKIACEAIPDPGASLRIGQSMACMLSTGWTSKPAVLS